MSNLGTKPLMKYHVNLQYENGKTINTWGVIPISSQTKILHGVYNPELKNLRIYLDSSIEEYKEIPVKDKGKIVLQQRKLDTYYSIPIEQSDIKFFLDNYVDNNFDIDPSIKELVPKENDKEQTEKIS